MNAAVSMGPPVYARQTEGCFCLPASVTRCTSESVSDSVYKREDSRFALSPPPRRTSSIESTSASTTVFESSPLLGTAYMVRAGAARGSLTGSFGTYQLHCKRNHSCTSAAFVFVKETSFSDAPLRVELDVPVWDELGVCVWDEADVSHFGELAVTAWDELAVPVFDEREVAVVLELALAVPVRDELEVPVVLDLAVPALDKLEVAVVLELALGVLVLDEIEVAVMLELVLAVLVLDELEVPA